MVASLVVDHGLQGVRASVFAAPWALEHRLSCPMACGIFPDQESDLCLLHWRADSYLCATREAAGAFL